MGTTDLTPEDELALTLIAMAEEGNDMPKTEDVAQRIGRPPNEADITARALENRRLVGRIVTMGKPYAGAVYATDEAFLWRDENTSVWSERRNAAEEWLKAQPAGAPVSGSDLSAAATINIRTAKALIRRWATAGAVANVHDVMPNNVFGINTGLPPR